MLRPNGKLYQLTQGPTEIADIAFAGGGSVTRLVVKTDGAPVTQSGPADGSEALVTVNQLADGYKLEVSVKTVPQPLPLTPSTTNAPWSLPEAGLQEFMVTAPADAATLEISVTTETDGALTDFGLADTMGNGIGGASYDTNAMTATADVTPGAVYRARLGTNQAASGTVSVLFKSAQDTAPATDPVAT